ncbi:hypothetical protein BKA93DRAFT_729111, partial [Sparassis latifolia]
AWLIFEHAITLTDEIDYIRRCKKTGVAVLFISNRFLGLVYALGMVVQIPPWSTNPVSCYSLFSALRVYIVGGQSWLPAVIVFILSLVPFATNLVLLITLEQRYLLSLSTVYLATQISLIVADIIVLAVTWMKTYSIKRYANLAHTEAPLATLLLQDG